MPIQPILNRRLLIGGAAAASFAAPAIVRAQALFLENPFKLGVASGDPSSDGFVIWTRLAPRPLELHTVGRDAWRADFKVLDQVHDAGGKLSLRKSFAVEPGAPGLKPA